MPGQLTLDRNRDRGAPWRWVDQSGSIDMDDRIFFALVRLPERPDRISGRQLQLGNLVTTDMIPTPRGRAIIMAYREQQQGYGR